MTELESCNAFWQFDDARMRYRRAPKDVGLTDPALETEWDPYVALEIDADTGNFAVVLNGDRTRVLRSHLHDDGCPWCVTLTSSEPALQAS